MEKPLCKLCKERHLGLCSQAAIAVDDRNRRDDETRRKDMGSARAKTGPASQPRAEVDQTPIPRKGRQDQSGNDVVSGGAKERPVQPSPKQKFDKVAYQARYMREVYRPRLKSKQEAMK